MSAACRYIAICKASEVRDGCAVKVEREGLTLAVFNVEGEFFVTNDLCTHGPGSLSEGSILGDRVECDFHNGAFNIKTGQAIEAPCTIPLTTYKTRLQGEMVEIQTL